MAVKRKAVDPDGNKTPKAEVLHRLRSIKYDRQFCRNVSMHCDKQGFSAFLIHPIVRHLLRLPADKG